MMWLERLLAIALKEVRQLARDRITVGLIVGIPTIQAMARAGSSAGARLSRGSFDTGLMPEALISTCMAGPGGTEKLKKASTPLGSAPQAGSPV